MDYTLLRNLLHAYSPSGYERYATQVFLDYAVTIDPDTHQDPMNNCFATVKRGGQPSIMLTAHIDEVGLIVKYIDDKGRIYFDKVGQLDDDTIPSRRVMIHTRNGLVPGVIGKKPVHIQSGADKTGKTPYYEYFIDIGANSREQVEEKIMLGDAVNFTSSIYILENDCLAAKGLDNKAGVFAILKALELMAEERFQASVTAVATAQEEVGNRGAITAAYQVNPDVGLVVDCISDTTMPTINKRQWGNIELGKGPVISRGTSVNSNVRDLLLYAAKNQGIPHQIYSIANPRVTDANALQVTRRGVAVGLIGIPLRYMHTNVEMVNLKDIEYTIQLLVEFCKLVTPETEFLQL